MDQIKSELDIIYIYDDERFLTMEEAIEYKELLEHMKNKKELISKWNKYHRLKFTEKAWKEE